MWSKCTSLTVKSKRIQIGIAVNVFRSRKGRSSYVASKLTSQNGVWSLNRIITSTSCGVEILTHRLHTHKKALTKNKQTNTQTKQKRKQKQTKQLWLQDKKYLYILVQFISLKRSCLTSASVYKNKRKTVKWMREEAGLHEVEQIQNDLHRQCMSFTIILILSSFYRGCTTPLPKS